MNRFKDFFNKVSQSKKIFSREEIKNMTSDEFRKNEKAIDYQMENIGVPSSFDLNRNIGTVTGGASYVDGMNAGDVLQSVLYEDVINPIFPMTSKSIRNGMHDMSEAKKDKNATILKDLNSINDKKLFDFMKDTTKIPVNTQGIRYNNSSSTAKKLANYSYIKNFIKDNYDELKNSNIESALIKTNKLKSPDIWGTFGSFTLYNPRIDKNNNFSAQAVDYYNFSDSKSTNMPNKWGYGLQEKGILQNYYTVTDIFKKLKK